MTEKVLDYDKLVEAYSANLEVTLRGFLPAEEMLDTWVPDEDPIRSLSSLVEAAQLCGTDTVSVRVSNNTLKDQPAATLQEKLATLGDFAAKQDNGAMVLTISNLQETAAFRSVRPIYHQKLRARVPTLAYKRALKVGDTHTPLRAVEERFSLAWAVQSDNHIITDAVFDGPGSGPMVAALDSLCEILIGMPVLEAHDHSVIRLEYSLRDPRHAHAISGIVMPRNADPIFRVPSILVRRLFNDYQTSTTSYRPGMNFYDPGPKAAWKALPPEERERRILAVFAEHGPALGLHNGEVHIVDGKHPVIVTIHFSDHVTIPEKRRISLSLERLVRDKCDPRIEVFLEEKKDLSQLRRLTDKVHKDHKH